MNIFYIYQEKDLSIFEDKIFDEKLIAIIFVQDNYKISFRYCLQSLVKIIA